MPPVDPVIAVVAIFVVAAGFLVLIAFVLDCTGYRNK